MELTLILPGALLPKDLPAEHRKPLFADLPLPALNQLLARGCMTPTIILESASLTSVLEQWLARSFCVPPGVSAPYCAQWDQVTAHIDALWMLQPVHFHVARDHIVLTDPGQLNITQDQASALLASIQPLFAELEWQLYAPQPQRWYVAPPNPLQLNATTLEAALGRSVDRTLPSGADARTWKRLMNEVQMVWHEHPVNMQREAQGELAINSLWLYGGSSSNIPIPTKNFDAVYADVLYARALATAAGAESGTARSTPSLTHACTLQIDQSLQPSLMTQDWYQWRNGWLQLEHNFFAPLLDLLGRRILRRLTLVLCGEQQAFEVVITPLDLWKFWRSTTLENSLAERSM